MLNHTRIPITRQSGFTLVEIAIVLVIIGLLLGGVLKGQELIKNAKIKTYKTSVDAISTAYNSYLDRYRAVPGDDSNATARFPVATFVNVANGNGFGTVDGWYGDNTLSTESNQFFIHLMAAGFIKGDPNAASAIDIRPKGPSGETLGISHNGHNIAGLAACYGAVNGELAELIDIAFDDGRPGSGTVRIGTNAAWANYTAVDANFRVNTYTLCMQL